MESGWFLTLYPEAGEAGGSYRGDRSGSGSWGSDPDRALVEAVRRAKGKVRRYCAANGLNRFGTLTYAGEGEHDPKAVRGDIRRFFRGMRRGLGGEAFPYLWVPELHKSDHGFHIHFVVDRYVRRGLIESAWGRGFVFIKLIQGLPVDSGVREEARIAARYVSKYLGKEMAASGGLNRYDVAQGFQPGAERICGESEAEVISLAVERMGGAKPMVVWRSVNEEEWQGPPALWVQWR